MHNRYEIVLGVIADAYQAQPATARPEPRPYKPKPQARPIRSMIVDAARPLHDAWDKLTRQPQPQPMTIYDASPWT